jgi:hypothetical protein
MTRPSDAPIFEVRATLPDGARERLGLYATEDDAAGHAQLLIAAGLASRVETIKRVNGRVELVAVVGPWPRFGARQPVDRRWH